jgi:translation initiation factor IF-3
MEWMIYGHSLFSFLKSVLAHFKEGKEISNEAQINEQIRDREIRLIGENGEQLGVMSSREAFQKAQDAGLDLVKVAPMAKPPVCKIVDYGKYRYEQARREKEARKKQHTVDIKEIRMSPNIDTNDLNTKVGAARKFLTKGDKVKVTIRFRGREMAHMTASRPILLDFAKALEDICIVEKQPKIEGRNMSIVLGQKRK